MGVLNDVEITRLSIEGWIDDYGRRHRMIEPFAEGKKRSGKISYGVSSYGYDLRIGEEFMVFDRKSPDVVVDPKNFDAESVCRKRIVPINTDGCGYLVLPPHSFALGVTVEKFDIPRDVVTICLGKSTYARCGLYLNVTPFEPEWVGHATIEIANPTDCSALVYANEGIGQLIFLQAGLKQDCVREPDINGRTWPYQQLTCKTSYADKKGKYQDQTAEVTTAKVDKEEA